MRQKQIAWHLAPGFSVIDAMKAFQDNGAHAVEMYDEISVRPKNGWKRVVVTVSVEHKAPNEKRKKPGIYNPDADPAEKNPWPIGLDAGRMGPVK